MTPGGAPVQPSYPLDVVLAIEIAAMFSFYILGGIELIKWHEARKAEKEKEKARKGRK